MLIKSSDDKSKCFALFANLRRSTLLDGLLTKWLLDGLRRCKACLEGEAFLEELS